MKALLGFFLLITCCLQAANLQEVWRTTVALKPNDGTQFSGYMLFYDDHTYHIDMEGARQYQQATVVFDMDIKGRYSIEENTFYHTVSYKKFSLNRQKTTPAVIQPLLNSGLIEELNGMQFDPNEVDSARIIKQNDGLLIDSANCTFTLLQRLDPQSYLRAISGQSGESYGTAQTSGNSNVVACAFNGIWYCDVWVQGTIGAGGVNTTLNGSVSDLMRIVNTIERTVMLNGEKVVYLARHPSGWSLNMSSMTSDGANQNVSFTLNNNNVSCNGRNLSFAVQYQDSRGYTKIERYNLDVQSDGSLLGTLRIEDYYNNSMEVRYDGHIRMFNSPEKLYAFQKIKAQRLQDMDYYESMQRSQQRINSMWSSVVKSREFQSDMKAESFGFDPNIDTSSDFELERRQNAVRDAMYKQGIYYKAR